MLRLGAARFVALHSLAPDLAALLAIRLLGEEITI